MADDDDATDPREIIAFEHEMLVAANVFAAHWENLGPPTSAQTLAFMLMAARVFVTSEEPMTMEDFVALAAQLYERALAEANSGALVNVSELEEKLPAVN